MLETCFKTVRFCQGDGKIGIRATNHGSTDGKFSYRPIVGLFANCVCTDNMIDAKCGPDASLLGIRCPFDWSACRRKCCRAGRSGGRCVRNASVIEIITLLYVQKYFK